MCYLYATKSSVLFLKGVKYLKPESLQLSVERGGETKFSARSFGEAKQVRYLPCCEMM